ncbi:phage tail fiber protein [Kluyvera georgiana ATCC 51603]|uniref:Phage tail fiber protein n=1 Tax=Kluyvera georgiana ATCC 51603 TaxID=1354264 RepID=A0A1B7JW34_9ENTR|nr:phage tail tube protein [Kluyvera georgiana]OAT52129.1 phage tail fiber protein [Kluyvera georgiana ATCC 51603]
MTTPNPLAPVKGATTTLWIYSGTGNPFANPVSDTDWTRLAKIKDLQPGELTAESNDDTYLDDEDADWTATAQGQKSAGEASFTLAWKPAESGQQDLVRWFDDGTVLAYKIKYPNGAVDVFRGWVSSLGKTVTAKDTITRSVKISNNGKPGLAEESAAAVIDVTGVTLDKSTATVAVAATTTLNVTVAPASATDNSFRATTTDAGIVTVSVADTVLTVTGIAAGSADIIVMTNDGLFVATCSVTVS